ncbi:Uncharacterised protein [Shigella sonnei]|nr:Uncharacterised protein [Shigella sonnei]CSS08320.1 Uncharacterised protein [Shigella sonnei]
MTRLQTCIAQRLFNRHSQAIEQRQPQIFQFVLVKFALPRFILVLPANVQWRLIATFCRFHTGVQGCQFTLVKRGPGDIRAL